MLIHVTHTQDRLLHVSLPLTTLYTGHVAARQCTRSGESWFQWDMHVRRHRAQMSLRVGAPAGSTEHTSNKALRSILVAFSWYRGDHHVSQPPCERLPHPPCWGAPNTTELSQDSASLATACFAVAAAAASRVTMSCLLQWYHSNPAWQSAS
jgi:hypothetical protein